MPAKPIVKKPKPVIVHLGNVGDSFAAKTRAYSKRFPNARFVGIDIKSQISTVKNWRQIKAGFAEGLKKLRNNSVSVISSDMALGYYPERNKIQYSEETIHLAFRKLKKGGKLYAAVHPESSGILSAIARLAGFSQVRTRPFTKIEYERTSWTSAFREKGHSLVQMEIIK
ncbi:MAG: class I SAM-dependent methyltransferase [Candidatus Diapherotrites archaeon]|nr:class I SAM-dependent methyltransferase [Candidatus Diapherotrites archaeon]